MSRYLRMPVEDPDLAAALAERGIAVPEERVAALLLDDLEALCR